MSAIISEITTTWAEVRALHRQLTDKIAHLDAQLATLATLASTQRSPAPEVAVVAAEMADHHPDVADVARDQADQPHGAAVAADAAAHQPAVAAVAPLGRQPTTKATDVAGVAAKMSGRQPIVAEVAPSKPEQPHVAEVAGPTPNQQPSVAAIAGPTPGRKRREERGIYRRGKTWYARFSAGYLGTFETHEAAVAARKVAIDRYEKMKKYAYPDPSVEIITVRNYVPTPDAEEVGVTTTLPTPSPVCAVKPAIDPEAVAHLKQLQQRFQRPQSSQPRRNSTIRPS